MLRRPSLECGMLAFGFLSLLAAADGEEACQVMSDMAEVGPVSSAARTTDLDGCVLDHRKAAD